MTYQHVADTMNQGRQAFRTNVPLDYSNDADWQWGWKDEAARQKYHVDGAPQPPKPYRDPVASNAHQALAKAFAAMDKVAAPAAPAKPQRRSIETMAQAEANWALAHQAGCFSANKRNEHLIAEYFSIGEISASTGAIHQLICTKLWMRYETHRKLNPDLDGTDVKSQTLLRLIVGERIIRDDAYMAEKLGAAIRHDVNFGMEV